MPEKKRQVAKKKPTLLEDLSPGSLPGCVIDWRCWRVRGAMDRVRLEGPQEEVGPVVVPAQTAVVACGLAARAFRGALYDRIARTPDPEAKKRLFAEADEIEPNRVEVEAVLPQPMIGGRGLDPSTWPREALRPRPPELEDEEPERLPGHEELGRELPGGAGAVGSRFVAVGVDVRAAVRGVVHRLATAVAKKTNGIKK
jgi:hypothetical protein